MSHSPKTRNPRIPAILAITTAVFIWGFSFVGTKIALRDVPPFTIALVRFSLASLMLYSILHWRKDSVKISVPDKKRMALTGFLGISLYFAFENTGIKLSTASDAALLMAAIPIFTVLLERVWQKKTIPRSRSLGILISIAGVYLIIGRAPTLPQGNRVLGDVLVLLAAIVWAIYSLVSKSLDRYPKLALVAYQEIFGALCLIPFALAEFQSWRPVHPSSVLAILYLAIFCSALAYLLYNYALKSLEASQVNAFANLVPFLGLLAGMLILKESVHLLQLAGGFLIMGGVALSSRY